MIISQALYRARQFWSAWRAQTLTEEELAPAHLILTTAQMELFSRLQPSEQIHALRVLQTIHTQGENDSDLQTAALLHDVGKTRAPLKIWERVAIVLGKGFFPKRSKIWGAGQPQGWKRCFVVAEQHAAWGAEMASEAGTSPLAVSLIRRHQYADQHLSSDPQINRLLKILQEADHQN